ncbi:glucosamine kinase [Mycolicibacterium sp. BiH015]|uniref:glucosamine kinase n=1 Tax=Mycolicibacterium sp. BiH015 TaxID=3018808 RepID=UPI0022DF1A75|nr:glucosamine kinase [Mycolicibacterium sp. BiH015]MDA2890578.1 glucosamine kinase [Mycolicibacterium sp. BiH015]
MPDVVDMLDLGAGHRLSITSEGTTLSALPMVRDGGRWRRAVPRDGASEALLDVLAQQSGSWSSGNFTMQSWAARKAAGEQAMGVDQTNESVIVGDTAVVKWATHLQDGPHPAPSRIAVLRDAEFTGMPAPWGLITWHPPDGDATLAVYVDEYLPGAVDGWTWAVDLMTASASSGDAAPVATAAAEVGALIADLHAALTPTRSTSSMDDARRWHRHALHVLESACAVTDSRSGQILRAHRDVVAAELECLSDMSDVPVIDGHGDLHVGQVLRSGGHFVVTDFDGNPVLPSSQRALPIPAVVDVAGMAQSLAHVAVVAARYTALETDALAAVDTTARTSFLDAYTRGLSAAGHTGLYDPRPLRALRIQQVMREMIYAAEYLPRWMYVPDAALPALLEEGTAR